MIEDIISIDVEVRTSISAQEAFKQMNFFLADEI